MASVLGGSSRDTHEWHGCGCRNVSPGYEERILSKVLCAGFDMLARLVCSKVRLGAIGTTLGHWGGDLLALRDLHDNSQVWQLGSRTRSWRILPVRELREYLTYLPYLTVHTMRHI